MEKRINELFKMIDDSGLDGLFVSNPKHIRYLTGFYSDSGYLLLAGSESFLLTDFRHHREALETADVGEVINYNDEGLIETINRLIDTTGMNNLGFEEYHLTVQEYNHLAFSCDDVQWSTSSRLVESMRIIKDKTEIKAIKKAGSICDQTFVEILELIKPGITERELAAKIDYLMVSHGADGPAFDTIVLSGEKSSLPHSRPSARRVKEGEFILMDFGCKIDGYCSDMTRTVALGDVDDVQMGRYQLVLDAHHEALSAIRTGERTRDVDLAARQVIDRAGLRKAFGHALGHGVGLDVHEAPRLSILSKDTLKKDMVITVEPGIYIEGEYGIRIEDTLRVTDKGYELYTVSPRELIRIPIQNVD